MPTLRGVNTILTSSTGRKPAARAFPAQIGWLLLALAVIALWDLAGLDLPMAHWFGTAQGFALRDHWLWSKVLHEGARRVAWALQFMLLLAVWWPFGILRSLTRRQRAMMFVAAMACLVVVSTLKNMNSTSCPWDLAEFGGTARYVSHWDWWLSDGGVGRCFPAGHASAAFCFLPGYFWLRGQAPRAAGFWLAATLLAAFTIGLAQQVRGAHYFSHTLWTGWMCWVVTVVSYWLLEHKTWRRPVAAGR
jgi:membrane-associated PAP2 superfamily phosphatase